ncbi:MULTISPECIES: malonate decarboxylase holo-ACP synthase [unclassified Cupriavidus]|uniref:malonate decarboxylase holo-ACP synthase n=1 Tax=unclassified Cupriavidus TaxID=2640874 RepID=UPI001C001EE0|nr:MULTISPECIES: malonate decarboxylase holo-ACP synthase [unclassified Cupriavidus]MCA3184997.1 malonate decarboxylase holo-ACP synthase [Cupriavidus sp.]MCA3188497.1 malonate decarboxylase holo-ACP synthase [Cupriavidus sp.]MCA3199487.1 malonate decarboxylase holo-ACP synthase [Cupriavidus sp.]MCA3204494.1 malonate decarboxylase holo-ACP synthase [Cupriavidus sp.]MCA3230963.1 malonate decarboxylase holo-ACP synthase [Cupriavidus sp.]
MRLHPHDLIWLRDPGAFIAAGDVPDWADADWLAQAPLVVRRDRDTAGRASARIPVGIRGRTRAERHAGWIDADQCATVVSPFDIAREGFWRLHPRRDAIPALHTLDPIARQLGALPYRWGVTGAVGFTLASGIDVLHAGSDIDLLLDAPAPLSAATLAALQSLIDTDAVRLDIQVATPRGAFALRERLRTHGRVLLKTDSGPVLTEDPWRAPCQPC